MSEVSFHERGTRTARREGRRGAAGTVTGLKIAYGELTVEVERARWLDAARALRDDPELFFISFIDITAADYPEREQRFDVVLHLLSPQAQSAHPREDADRRSDARRLADQPLSRRRLVRARDLRLFGVLFDGHPDLRRIMTDYGFDGHPLRKDFPMTGYVEVRYDDERKRVVYEPVNLTQEYRKFDFLSPWEGVAI